VLRPPPKANKAFLQGGELLLKRSEWPPLESIQGNDLTMFESPTIAKAFKRTLETWEPRRPVMVTSLCTSTRPYSASRKWWAYASLLGDDVDLVVCTNGGIVPLPFEGQFPFLNYDAKGQARFDEQYIKVVGNRLERFIRKFRYRHVVFSFLQGMRNRVIAERLGPMLVRENVIEGFTILPSDAIREQARAEIAKDPNGYMVYPDIWPCMLQELVSETRQICRLHGITPSEEPAVFKDILRLHGAMKKRKGLFDE
jgi:hypothetical protein